MADSQKKLRVLIVDDDISFLCDMSVLLSSEFEIMTASGTRDAALMIEEFQPDCMLLDVNMPSHFGNDPATEGHDFLEHLRFTSEENKKNNLNIIIVSSSVSENQLQTDFDNSICAWFPKPPNLKKLKETIIKNKSL